MPDLARSSANARPVVLQFRQADRRAGPARVIEKLARSLAAEQEPYGLHKMIEEGLRHLLPVKAVKVRQVLRESVVDRSGERGILSVHVPAALPQQMVSIEALYKVGHQPSDWDRQTARMLADTAVMVFELERRAFRMPRGGRLLQTLGDAAAPLIGSSAAMQTLRARIERVANTDFTALIEGESGTGKELVARQLHALSPRHQGPFVPINCAALVESLLEAELFGIEDRTATGVRGRRGKFEHAEGGTLFLDEVSDLSMSAQAKLLRAIQELAVERVGSHETREVDARIIVATNRPLAALVGRGLFRQDLYYRLSGVELAVPPLRDRQTDIIELAQYFLARYRSIRPLELSQTAEDALRAYHWPGNVRELERLMEGVVALAESSTVEVDDLPPVLRGDYGEILLPSAKQRHRMRRWASRYARLMLEKCQNNKRRTCRELGISYHTLRTYLRYQDDLEEVTQMALGPDTGSDASGLAGIEKSGNTTN
ncbi:MAG: sigma-54-dependent Fis family transcriptional regulator, partial [Acidobacteria bacterium]|nr:sigma-54-dependent Fis family transcriptional regulator [Acidobacteriota bacterium]MBI3263596.1 sigma-54-dependent Fis family transcriptional regulator [Acidobacteriota bacterium]